MDYILTRTYPRLTRENSRKLEALVPPKIVHLGLGAFARAHMGEYVRRLDSLPTDEPWLISGVSLRTPHVRDSLRPQQGAYTIVERDGPRDAPNDRFTIAHCVTELLCACDDADIIKSRLADSQTKIISITVTEKGYCRDAEGLLDLRNSDIQSDIKSLSANPKATVRTLPGWLAQAILLRAKKNLPITIMSLDNLPQNGTSLHKTMATMLRLLDPNALLWVDEGNVSFPNSVVDRIVPATSKEDVNDVSKQLKLNDAWPVVTEPYISWILEQKFSSPQPKWNLVGVSLVKDVVPYEEAKLRLLNGSHSLIAYLGQLTDKETVAETVDDEIFGKAVQGFMTEIGDTIELPKTFDLRDYQSEIFGRFCNIALNHKTAQIASDGSEKIPQRWLEAIIVLRREEKPVRFLAMALAIWIRYLHGSSERGTKLDISDPRKDRLIQIVTSGFKKRSMITDVMGLLSSDLATDLAFIANVERCYAEIISDGCRSALKRLLG